MIHLTFVGYYAGRPFCEVNKVEALERGEQFAHYVYWRDMDDPRLCPDCKAFAESEDEEDEAQS